MRRTFKIIDEFLANSKKIDYLNFSGEILIPNFGIDLDQATNQISESVIHIKKTQTYPKEKDPVYLIFNNLLELLVRNEAISPQSPQPNTNIFINDYFAKIIEPNWKKIKYSLIQLKNHPDKFLLYWKRIYNQIIDLFKDVGITFKIVNDGNCNYFIE